VQYLAKSTQVVTGDSAEPAAEEESAASPFAGLDKPVVVFVVDLTQATEGFDKLQEVVFKNEKIGLAMKAFRAVRITPEDAERDPILKGHGEGSPRLLVVDPVKEDVEVLEESRIKVSTLFAAMKATAKRFWKESLDGLVKDHLKLLTERDQLANEVKVLADKESRMTADGEEGPKLAEVKAEREKVEAELTELATQERELWSLTRRA
jgi:hypothetical protein